MTITKNKKHIEDDKLSLLVYLRKLSDFRRAEGKRHELINVLIIFIMAVASDFVGYRSTKDFIENNKEELLKILKPRKNKLPSRFTIARIFCKINFEELAYLFEQWASQHIKLTKQDWLSLDGKIIRGTLPKEAHKFVNLVSLFAHKSKQILKVGKVFEKSNEIPLVQKMITEISLKGQILMADALHCQKKTTKKIVESGNFYVLGVKENQKKLFRKVKFVTQFLNPISKNVMINKNKGRNEKRETFVYDINPKDLDLEFEGWIDIKRIIKVKRRVITNKNISCETVYFISNLEEKAKEFNQGIRNHWLIESMHWIKDVVFKEDKCKIISENSPENISIIRNFVLGIFRLKGFESMIQATRLLCCKIKKLFLLLGGRC